MKKFKIISVIIVTILLLYGLYRGYNYYLFKEAEKAVNACEDILNGEDTRGIMFFKITPESPWIEYGYGDYDYEKFYRVYIILNIWINDNKICYASVLYPQGTAIQDYIQKSYLYRTDGTLARMEISTEFNTFRPIWLTDSFYYSTKGKLVKIDREPGRRSDFTMLSPSNFDIYYTTDELLKDLNIKLP